MEQVMILERSTCTEA